jgi:hypothetical protein
VHVKSLRLTGGIPAWRANSAAAKAVRGVSSEGFKTTVQPQARAGPTYASEEKSMLFFNNKLMHQKRLTFFAQNHSKMNTPF